VTDGLRKMSRIASKSLVKNSLMLAGRFFYASIFLYLSQCRLGPIPLMPWLKSVPMSIAMSINCYLVMS